MSDKISQLLKMATNYEQLAQSALKKHSKFRAEEEAQYEEWLMGVKRSLERRGLSLLDFDEDQLRKSFNRHQKKQLELEQEREERGSRGDPMPVDHWGKEYKEVRPGEGAYELMRPESFGDKPRGLSEDEKDQLSPIEKLRQDPLRYASALQSLAKDKKSNPKSKTSDKDKDKPKASDKKKEKKKEKKSSLDAALYSFGQEILAKYAQRMMNPNDVPANLRSQLQTLIERLDSLQVNPNDSVKQRARSYASSLRAALQQGEGRQFNADFTVQTASKAATLFNEIGEGNAEQLAGNVATNFQDMQPGGGNVGTGGQGNNTATPAETDKPKAPSGGGARQQGHGAGASSNQYGLPNEQAVVAKIQQYLISQKINVPGGADGKLGPMTKAALGVWQKQVGLPVTKQLDKATWDKLAEVVPEVKAFTQAATTYKAPIDLGYARGRIEAARGQAAYLLKAYQGGQLRDPRGAQNALEQLQPFLDDERGGIDAIVKQLNGLAQNPQLEETQKKQITDMLFNANDTLTALNQWRDLLSGSFAQTGQITGVNKPV